MRNERSGGVGQVFENAAKRVRNLFSPRSRYLLVMPDQLTEIYDSIARRKGVRTRDLIPRALASYVWLQRELAKNEDGIERHLVIRQGPKVVQRINLP